MEPILNKHGAQETTTVMEPILKTTVMEPILDKHGAQKTTTVMEPILKTTDMETHRHDTASP